jgi:hypothetical protein
VCFFDGATSLYFSAGGGVIGCGEREPVKKAAKDFVAIANKLADLLTPASECPLPKVGMVRFYVRTAGGTLTHEAREIDLGEKRDPLWPLFYAAHGVITKIRELGLV